MRRIWSCTVLAGAMLGTLTIVADPSQAAAGTGSSRMGALQAKANHGFRGNRAGFDRTGFAGQRHRQGTWSGGRSARRYGGFSYGGFYGGYGYSYGMAFGAPGAASSSQHLCCDEGYPVALGIRPAPVLAPTTYLVGSRRDFAAARRGSSAYRGDRSLRRVADMGDVNEADQIQSTRPRVIRVP